MMRFRRLDNWTALLYRTFSKPVFGNVGGFRPRLQRSPTDRADVMHEAWLFLLDARKPHLAPAFDAEFLPAKAQLTQTSHVI
jgi:hypothetical protein